MIQNLPQLQISFYSVHPLAEVVFVTMTAVEMSAAELSAQQAGQREKNLGKIRLMLETENQDDICSIQREMWHTKHLRAKV